MRTKIPLWNGSKQTLRSHLYKMWASVLDYTNHKAEHSDIMVYAPNKSKALSNIKAGIYIEADKHPNWCLSGCIPPTAPSSSSLCDEHTIIRCVKIDGTTDIEAPLVYRDDVVVVNNLEIPPKKWVANEINTVILDYYNQTTTIEDEFHYYTASTYQSTGGLLPLDNYKVTTLPTGVYKMIIAGGGGSGAAMSGISMVAEDHLCGGSTERTHRHTILLLDGYSLEITVGVGGEAVSAECDTAVDANVVVNGLDGTVTTVKHYNSTGVLEATYTSSYGEGGTAEVSYNRHTAMEEVGAEQESNSLYYKRENDKLVDVDGADGKTLHPSRNTMFHGGFVGVTATDADTTGHSHTDLGVGGGCAFTYIATAGTYTATSGSGGGGFIYFQRDTNECT